MHIPSGCLALSLCVLSLCGPAARHAAAQAKDQSAADRMTAAERQARWFKPVETEGNRDYELTGEYWGWQQSRPSSRSSEAVGLQVTTPAPGKFAGVKYFGGLPGSGWFGGERFEYSGERHGDVLLLKSPDYTIEVDGNAAHIYTADGRSAGELRKVHRVSPTLDAPPPPGAIVLFNGHNAVDELIDPIISEDRLLMAGTETRQPFGDCRLHVEFRVPYLPQNSGQNRGNSGVYVQSRYEIQILDSFGRPPVRNECGSIYTQRAPDINMSFPPGTWQTYDIDFTAPRFDEHGKKIANARFSIWQNGVQIHNHVEAHSKTGHGLPEGPDPKPFKFQDHQSPVEYQNLWILPRNVPASAPAGQSAAKPGSGQLTRLVSGNSR